METKYTLTVNNKSNHCGSICVYQTVPDQPDNMLSLAWFSKAAHPGTTEQFDWNTDYNFVWPDQDALKPRVTFQAAAEPEANRTEHIQPKYYVAFGDFKEGDSIDVTMLENAVELELSKEGTTIVIHKDNSIRVE